MCRSTCLPPVEGKKRDPGNEVGSSPWLGIAQERRGLSLFILGVFTHVVTRPRWWTKQWQIALKFCIIIASQIAKRLFTLFSNSPIEDLLTVLMLQSRRGVQINLIPRKNFICHDDNENIITWPTTILRYSASSHIADVKFWRFLAKTSRAPTLTVCLATWKVFLRYMPWLRFP